MSKENLTIVVNEKLYSEKNNYFCDNIDIKTITEGLDKYFYVTLVTRGSRSKNKVQILNGKIFKITNLINFLKFLFTIIKPRHKKFLFISITPFTFLFFLICKILNKDTYIFLRSDGFKEYKFIFGASFVWIYALMYRIFIYRSKIIICQKNLVKNKSFFYVQPSELDKNWFINHKKPKLEEIKLLYVGRLKVEKGIFSFLNLFDKSSLKINFTILSKVEDKYKNNLKINYLNYENDIEKLITIYDDHNVIILPSFTEAHPKVLDESLARLRPVVIFEDIKHIVQDRKGIFVINRDITALDNILRYIISNYSSIQNSMLLNKLPTRGDFIKQMKNALI